MTGLVLGWDKPLSRQSIGFASQTANGRQHERSLITDDGEGHLLAVGRTGSGKGRSIIIPTLLHYKGSVVIVDVKGEAAAVTARHRREMGQKVVILDPFGRVGENTDAFNPMTMIRADGDDIADSAMVMAEMLRSPGTPRDPFWDDMACQLNAALIAYHAQHKDEAERSPEAVWRTLMNDDFRYHLAVLASAEEEPLHPFVYQQFMAFLQADERNVQTSLRTTAQQHMRVFGSKQVARATRNTTFSLDALREGEPMTIYIVIPPNRIDTYAPMLRLWISALLGELTEREHRPEIPTLFLIDELANIGPMPQVKQAITLLRGFGVRCGLFLQAMSQLKGMWPHDYETIIENCELLSIFGVPNLGAARQLESIIGDLSAETLLTLAPTDMALGRAGRPTRVVERLDYLHDPLFQGLYDQNPLYARKPVAHPGDR